MEKQKLENNIINHTDKKTFDYMKKLENEINDFKIVSKKYKDNCSELTQEICNLNDQIRMFTKQTPRVLLNK